MTEPTTPSRDDRTTPWTPSTPGPDPRPRGSFADRNRPVFTSVTTPSETTGAPAPNSVSAWTPPAPQAPVAAEFVPWDAPASPTAPSNPMPYGLAVPAGVAFDPAAPFGRALTGEPYSDKSKVAAGLLGIFLGTLGVGRFYLGHVKIGVAQLLLHLGGWIVYMLGSFVGLALTLADGSGETPGGATMAGAGIMMLGLGLGMTMIAAASLWALVDGILILSDRVKDGQGRPLRP